MPQSAASSGLLRLSSPDQIGLIVLAKTGKTTQNFVMLDPNDPIIKHQCFLLGLLTSAVHAGRLLWSFSPFQCDNRTTRESSSQWGHRAQRLLNLMQVGL